MSTFITFNVNKNNNYKTEIKVYAVNMQLKIINRSYWRVKSVCVCIG